MISVIVTVYNGYSSYIDRCIDSILEQTFRDFEIIIVDDNSDNRDGTKDVIQKQLNKCKNIILIENTSNMGSGLSKNEGVKRSSGEYIITIDCDDYIRKDCLEKLMKNMGDFDVLSPSLRSIGKQNKIDIKNKFDLLSLLIMKSPLAMSCLIRKEVWNEVGGCGDYVMSDWDLWIKISKSGFKIGCINDILIFYYRHQNSILEKIKNDNDKNIYNTYVIVKSHEDTFREYCDKNWVDKIIDYGKNLEPTYIMDN